MQYNEPTRSLSPRDFLLADVLCQPLSDLDGREQPLGVQPGPSKSVCPDALEPCRKLQATQAGTACECPAADHPERRGEHHALQPAVLEDARLHLLRTENLQPLVQLHDPQPRTACERALTQPRSPGGAANASSAVPAKAIA